MKEFNLKIVYNGNRGGLVSALEEVAEEIRSGSTDDVGRDYIAEIEDKSGNEVGYAYHENDYPYADIYGNPKEGGDDAKNKTKEKT